jgi:hypothetical protein
MKLHQPSKQYERWQTNKTKKSLQKRFFYSLTINTQICVAKQGQLIVQCDNDPFLE